MLQFLEHHDTRALAHHEAVAVAVPGPAAPLRRVVETGRERLARREPRDAEFADRRLRTAGDHHLRVAMRDHPRPVADGMRSGRAGGHHRMVRPLETVADRHLPRAEVDQARGNEERRHPPRPLVAQHQSGVGDGREPADARADDHPGPQPVFLVLRRPVGIAHRLRGGGHGIEDEAIDLAALLGRHPVVGVEGAVRPVAERNFAGDGAGQVRRIEARDPSCARMAREQPRPALLDPAGQWRDEPEPGDHNAPHRFSDPWLQCPPGLP